MKDQKFWDKIAEKYSRDPIADEASYQKKLEMTRALFHPDMQVLELGCGTGSTAIIHAPYVKHIRATDISENMLAIARRKTQAEHIENITYERVSIEDIVAENESVDMVLALSLLHLLRDEKTAVRRIYEMLKPGGFFISSTACLNDMMPLLRFVTPLGRATGLMPYVNFFTAQDLKKNIAAQGFEIEHFWTPAKNKAAFIIAKKPL